MNKVILSGICTTVFLLLATPTIPAQQCTLVKLNIQEDFEQHVNNLVLALQKWKENNAQTNKAVVLASLADLKETLRGLDAMPVMFKFFLSLLLSLIFAAIGALFGKVCGSLLVLIIKIITFLPRLLATIISSLFHGRYQAVYE